MRHRSHNAAAQPANEINQLLDMYGTLKDEVLELKEQLATQPRNLSARTIAAGHSHNEPWKPCDQEETRFYGSLTHLH